MRIFDQSTKTDSMHTKTIDLLEFPEKFHPILRRLELAAKDPRIRVVIEMEDDDEAELQEYKDELAQAKAEAEESQRQAEEAQRREEEAQRRAEESQRQAEEAQRQAEEAQRQEEEAQRQNENAILLMLRIGVDKQTIAENQGRSLEEIEEIESRNREE
jgi:colicin import membrane protein